MKRRIIHLFVLFILTLTSCKEKQDSKSPLDINQEVMHIIQKDTLFYLYELSTMSYDEKSVSVNVTYRFAVNSYRSNDLDTISNEVLNTNIIKPAVSGYLRNIINKKTKSELNNLRNLIRIPELNTTLLNQEVEIISLVPTVKNK